MTKPFGWALAALFAVTSSPLIAEDTPKGYSLSFTPSESTEYTFNTGTLSGKLRADGESVGPGEVIYSETGQMISRVYGRLNHYRVFSDGVRYGRGMRHLPRNAEVHDDASLTVVWPAAHSTQRHYALSCSLFGRDLEPGEVATARSRAVVLNNPDEEEILREASGYTI